MVKVKRKMKISDVNAAISEYITDNFSSLVFVGEKSKEIVYNEECNLSQVKDVQSDIQPEFGGVGDYYFKSTCMAIYIKKNGDTIELPRRSLSGRVQISESESHEPLVRVIGNISIVEL